MSTPSKHGGLFLGTWLVDRVNLFFRLRRYIKWVQERWLILATCVAISVGVSVYRAINTPDMFRAVSKISVAPKIQTPFKTHAEYQEEVSAFYDKQIEYMSSEHVLGGVRDQLRDSMPKKEGFTCLPTAFKGSASLVMQVDCTDFPFAAQFAKLWAHKFLAYRNELRGGALTKSAADTTDEINRQQKLLDGAREKLREFEKQNKVASIAEAGQAAQQRLDDLLRQRQEMQIRRVQLENRKPEEIAESGVMTSVAMPKSLTSSNGLSGQGVVTTDPVAVVDSAKFGDLKVKLRGLEAEQRHREDALRPSHPYMVALVKEIDATKQQIKYFIDQIEDRRLAQISELKQDEAGLLPSIEAARQEVLDKSSIQYSFEQLKENEANIKQTVESLQKQEQSIVAAPPDESFFSIDAEGVGDPHPVSPDRPKLIMGGLMFGTILGLGLIYLLGRLDDRLELAEDIEAELGERIIGQIPLVSVKLKAQKLLVTNLDKHNMFSESLRGVRSSIMFGTGTGEVLSNDLDRKVLLTTSAAPGDGKTTITTNLAVTLGTAGHRVLLIDGDLRRGNIHAYFGWSRGPGLAELLAGELDWEEVARQTDVPTLRVIPTGKLPLNPGELLLGNITEPFIKEVRQHFDYVIFDCPPLTAIDDAFSVARYADGVIFIIMSGQTSMRFAKTAITAMRQRGGKMLGLVLNGIRPDNPYYYYQQYYYSYYTLDEPEELPAATTVTSATPGTERPTEPKVVKTTTVRRRRRRRSSKLRSQLTSEEIEKSSSLPGETESEPELDGSETSPPAVNGQASKTADPAVETALVVSADSKTTLDPKQK